MKNKNIIYPSFQVNNLNPVNYKEEDYFIFKDFFYQSIPEFHWIEIANANIFYRHVTKRNWILDDYCSSHPIKFIDRVKIPFKSILYKRKRIEKAVSLVTLFGDSYHHFVAEVLPLVIVAKKIFGTKIAMIIPKFYFKHSYIASYFELLGVNILPYNSRDKISVDNLFLFSNIRIGHFNPKILNLIREEFVEAFPDNPWRSIFISRSKAEFRKIINEVDLYPTFNQFGIEVYFLEEMQVKDQIKLFSETKTLIGLHGAGLTNMVYMKKGGKVLELRAITSETHIYNVFYSMACACKHKYYYFLDQGDHQLNKLSNLKVNSKVFFELLKKVINE